MADLPLKICCWKCSQHLDVSMLAPFSTFLCPCCGEQNLVPRRFERYLLKRKIGEGGMAEVYQAEDESSGEELAVKIRTPQDAERETWTRRFQFELEALSAVDHPHILKLFRCGKVENKLFLAMEYLQNGDLENFQRKASLPPLLQRCRWIAQTAAGLAALSDAGLIHHDIKPGNLLLDADMNIKICDFDLMENRLDPAKETRLPKVPTGDFCPDREKDGIRNFEPATRLVRAKPGEARNGNGLKSANSGLSRDAGRQFETPGSCVEMYGSPDYVSPERLDSGMENEKGDVFSLGVTAYELLTGRCPFPGGRDEAEMLHIRKETVPVWPPTLQPALSAPISELLLNMLSFAPDIRPEYPEIISLFSEFIDHLKNKEEATC